MPGAIHKTLEIYMELLIKLQETHGGITLVSSARSDGWILDGCSCRNEEIVILCLHHLVAVILERDVSQRHCTDQSFSLLI